MACLALAALLLSCQAKPSEPLFKLSPDYGDWKKTTEKVLNYPIPGHEDKYRVPRMNGIGFGFKEGALEGKERVEFPAGTVIAKDIYANNPPLAGEKPVMATVMVKAPGDPASMGGWLWIIKNFADGSEALMKNRFCFTCHANANEKHPYADGNPAGAFRDYVFFVPGKDGMPASDPVPSAAPADATAATTVEATATEATAAEVDEYGY